jgi:hypothetical protein
MFKTLCYHSVVPAITGILMRFMFHIHCIAVHTLLYFSPFSPSFCVKFLSAGIATSVAVCMLPSLYLIVLSGLFAGTSLIVLGSHRNVSIASSTSSSSGRSWYQIFVREQAILTDVTVSHSPLRQMPEEHLKLVLLLCHCHSLIVLWFDSV